ncbi:MAG: hypothetical protein M3Z04_02665, partial [Chloroflexota bacterium]|nr:hypothetical protein [Chloroflexota bacterium]
MPDTRYLRPRATHAIDDATLAAAVAAVIGPPGLVRYPPRSPALFPPLVPSVALSYRRIGAAARLALVGSLLLALGLPVALTLIEPPRVSPPLPVAVLAEPATATGTP